jgi:hypothetical protein
MKGMQRTQFCAKSAKNDLKPTNFVKHNFYFEMEGVPYNMTKQTKHKMQPQETNGNELDNHISSN